ncbi:MAG: LON peptidase substrate-binding domain-containing protein [Acidimicrobiales bacterium]
MYELPMFPLGSVLVPSMVLPLHLFEPRYQALAEHLTDDATVDHAGEFGVVLIERGSEVGGGEVRERVGTVAAVAEASRFDDGRWALIAIGRRRVRVLEWLVDDPYPRALLEEWPDTDEPTEALSERYRHVVTVARRVLALSAELGDPVVASTVGLSDDPVDGSYQLTAVCPFGPADQQHLLAVPGAAERLEAISALLDDHAEMLNARLRLASETGPDDDDGPHPP